MRIQSRRCAALLSIFFLEGEGLHHAALQQALCGHHETALKTACVCGP